MRKIITAALAVSAAAFISAAAQADGELHIFTFGDYLSPDAVKAFSEKYNVKTTVNTYDDNDTMIAKIRTGASGYDIAIGGNWVMPGIIGEGLAERTEPNQMDNFKNIRPEFQNVSWDEGRHYTVPFLWGTTGFTVNKEYYKGPLDSWKLVFDPPKELDGFINAIPEQEDVINAISFYKGIKLCSSDKKDLKVIQQTLEQGHQHWRSQEYGVIDIMVSKNARATLNWNGSSMRARLQNPDITYVYPKEGYAAWFDNVFVVKGAPNLENAKLFQNFLMEPKTAAMLTMFGHYDNGIVDTAQYLPPEFKDAPEFTLPNGSKPNFVPACSPEVKRMHNKIWVSVMK